MNSRLENVIAILYGAALLPPLYVKATMNAIHDSYVDGISEFKWPFYILFIVLALILLMAFLVSVFVRVFKKKGIPLIHKMSLSAALSVLVVFLLGFAPCMKEHTDPHTIVSAVSQSLLCPSYSNRSYVGLLTVLGLAVGTLFVSRRCKKADS